MFTYLQFRKAMEHHQMLHVLPYKTKLQPYATWFTLFVLIILTLTNGFQGSHFEHYVPMSYTDLFVQYSFAKTGRFPLSLRHTLPSQSFSRFILATSFTRP